MSGSTAGYSRLLFPLQRNFSLSVNSVAVLRLMGKGAGTPLTSTSRGRVSARSRGRMGLVGGQLDGVPARVWRPWAGLS